MPDPSPEEKTTPDPVVAEEGATPDPVVAEEGKTDVNPAAEPSSAEGEDKGDMLSAVKAALAPKSAEPPPDSTTPDPKVESDPENPDAEEGAEQDESDDLTPEELSRLNKKTAKRIHTLLGERKSALADVETLKPKAEKFDAIVSSLTEATITKDELDWLVDVGRGLKIEPEAAYKKLTPVYQSLRRMFGEVLPDDLAEKVKQGAISPEDAKTIAVSRTREKLTADEAARRADADKKRTEADANEHLASEVGAEVTKWETTKAQADPDWNQKKDDVFEKIELILAKEGFPSSAADAVKIADRALAAVDAKLKKWRPAPQPVDPSVTDVTSAPEASAKPTTLLEAAKAGLASARG